MRTPWRTKAMKICSFLGTEDFYTPLVGLLTWSVKSFGGGVGFLDYEEFVKIYAQFNLCSDHIIMF